ncbi:pentatricopeptide repeat-containing protein [Sesbania bispinosa]|nr:pentatricopeptide repeat-containing protein [Sesbania bispinosa]
MKTEDTTIHHRIYHRKQNPNLSTLEAMQKKSSGGVAKQKIDVSQSIMGEECVVSKPTTDLSSRVHHIYFLESDQLINVAAFKKVESLRTLLHFESTLTNFRRLPSRSSLRALSTSSFQLSAALKSLTHLRLNTITGSETPCDQRCYPLVAMPPKIGKLTCLRTLSTFIVGSKNGFGLAELHSLQLGGKLHIKSLENVPNVQDAKEANLIVKKDLTCLYLTWGSDTTSQGANAEHERVLEALEPPSNLKHLPNWMRNTSVLKSLVGIILYNCKICDRLPTLGMKDVKTNSAA